MNCWKCKKEIFIEKIARTTECPLCHADLHCCKNCRFYSLGSHFDCKETVEELVLDKDKANFCDFFVLKDFNLTAGDDKAAKAKAQVAALFGETVDSKDSTSAKDAFNALFS